MQRGAESRSVRVRAAELVSRIGGEGAGRRWDPGRGGLLAITAVAVLVAVLVGGWVLSSRPHQIPVATTAIGADTGTAGGFLSLGTSASSSVSASARSPRASASPTGGGPVVDVAGKVRRPGVYRLVAGARVQDAVTAAGGMLPGVDPVSVNLARKVSDGEQIVIGGSPAARGSAAGAGAAAATGGAAGPSSASGPLDLNTATVAQLDGLPGVGPVLAQRIVDWRTQHGRFDSVDQLRNVSGIGDSKFADLSPLVTVS